MDCNTCTVKRPSNCSMCPENILNSDAMIYRMEQSDGSNYEDYHCNSDDNPIHNTRQDR